MKYNIEKKIITKEELKEYTGFGEAIWGEDE